MRRQCTAVALTFVLAILSIAASAESQPGTSSIGGQVVPSPREAPWSVLLFIDEGDRFGECSGSIVDAAHVVTAGHCTFDEAKARRPLDAYTVVAGIADASDGGDRSEEQVREVSSVRVPSGYAPEELGGDVAVLRVEPPFDLSPAGVAAIATVGENAGPIAGSTARLFGWGQVDGGRLDGRLHRLDQGLLERWQCASGVPSLLCAWSPTGAACLGDSGGGLVTPTSSPALLGVSSHVIFPTSACAVGGLTIYADLSTPEAHAWLAGDETPPQAPSTSQNPLLWGELVSGGKAICNTPQWTGSPATGTTFLYSTPGSYSTQIVQRGSSNRYDLGPRDVGRRLVCVSVATNAGGTTEAASWRPILIGGRSSELIDVREANRRGRRWRVRLGVAPSLRGERLRATWTGPSCAACPSARPIVIERRTRLVSPPMSGRRARLALRLPGLAVGEIPYRGSTLRVRLGARAKPTGKRQLQLRPLRLPRAGQAPPLPSHVGQVRRPSLLEGAEGPR